MNEPLLDLTEILKTCPEGMELDCAVFDNATLSKIDFDDVKAYPIVIKTNDNHGIRLTRYGTYILASEAKCLIFPKGKTTWEGFHKPFKDGDIVIYGEDMFAIFKEQISHQDNGDLIRYHLYYDEEMDYLDKGCGRCVVQRLATEEEVERLFKALQVKGYQWDTETKTLKVLEIPEPTVEPKFKAGDKIVNRLSNHMGASASQAVILGIDGDNYMFTDGSYIHISDQDSWELASNEVAPKFKEGDILYIDCNSTGNNYDIYQYIFILKEITDSHIRCHCFMDLADSNKEFKICNLTSVNYIPRIATDEEKQKLFEVIKANGYNWNSETKTLEKLKLVESTFKDGDIVHGKNDCCSYTSIYQSDRKHNSFYFYASLDSYGRLKIHEYADKKNLRLATDEEKQDLFDVLKSHRFKWNPKTKMLDELKLEPKFKVGDTIQSKDGLQSYTVSNVTSEYYSLKVGERDRVGVLPIDDQDDWSLVQIKRWDPKSLKHFDMVLATDALHLEWSAGFFSHIIEDKTNYPFKVGSARYRYCIPFNEDTQHLTGKSGKVPEFYRYWEDKI